MKLEEMYAHAVLQASAKKKASEVVKRLSSILKTRGHERLLPKILAEYEKLEEGKRRSAEYTAVTPDKERTRVLLDLYHRLLSTQ